MARANQVVGFKDNQNGTQTYTIGGESITFHADRVNPELRAKAEMHGWKQRISDKAALSRDPKTGKSATPQQKFAQVAALIKHYESGTDQWNMERVGGGGGRTELSYVMEALANVQGLEVGKMAERVIEMAEKRGITPEAYLRKVATSERVATEIARIKHGASEDADDYLDELDAATAEEHDTQALADGMAPEIEDDGSEPEPTEEELAERPNAA